MWKSVSRTAGGCTGHSTQQLTAQISSILTSNAGDLQYARVIQEMKNMVSDYGPKSVKMP
jgi:hypothetical protein